MGSRVLRFNQIFVLLLVRYTIIQSMALINFSSSSQSSEVELRCCLVPAVNSVRLVNCSNLSWTWVDDRCLPASTEVLLLDNNNLTTLTNGTFRGLSSLRRLSIQSSNVTYIELDAFIGLENLESLNLENNQLNNGILFSNPSVFRHFANLKELYIAENDVQFDTKTSDLDLIFSQLLNLTALSLDGSENLWIGKEFSKLTKLNNLTLNCYKVKNITDTSLFGLWNSSVKELNLLNFYEMRVDPDDIEALNGSQGIFSDDAFQKLRSLQVLRISDCKIGNQNIARKFKHFVNSSLHTLELKTTHYTRVFNNPNSTFEDGIVTKKTLKYLTQMKLVRFSWINSGILAISPGIIAYSCWRHHLKRVDFSGNNFGFLGWREPLLELSRLENLEEVVLSSASATSDQVYPKLKWLDDVNSAANMKPGEGSGFGNLHGQIVGKKVEENYAVTNIYDFKVSAAETNSHVYLHETKLTSIYEKTNLFMNFSDQSLSSITKGNTRYSQSLPFPGQTGTWFIRMPPSLRTLRIINLLQGESPYGNQTVIFFQNNAKAENLTHFYFTNNGLIRGTGHVLGLTNLQLFDLSENAFVVENYFFDDFPNLRYLILQSMRNEDFFQRIPIDRMIQNLPELRYLDLTNNKLNFLPRNIFVRNPHMSHVILSKNRFSSIPLTVSLVPNLMVLDMCGNAIPYLDDQEMTSLTAQRKKVPEIFVVLVENSIACVCSQIKFLYWLYTSDFVDNSGNYSCTSENGQLISTGILLQDLMGYYRLCNGYNGFLLSLVLFLLVSFIFLAAYLLHRFKNSIEAFIVRIFVKAFRPMKSTDYKTHVFIGYADDDIGFVRRVLSQFLERDLRVSTFIHQRDLGPGYTDHQMFDAIRDSWRYASHSVTPANQGRVVVLVHESQLHNIPGYIYDVLDESRIVVFSSLTSDLSYEHRQKIKQCLRDD
ncbi:hypothetical protein Btru_025624 [Bulinus truncatus]|nr:hypothetical protein Btru_025624 [Bulinus truncatus]